MKKQILIFGIFCLGLLTSLWICAQTENTISENTEKNSGDQLIEFLQNLPSKYEAGIESKLTGRESTYYHVKKDDFNLFYGFSTNVAILSSDNLKEIGTYHFTANDNNVYWQLTEKDLTTWTNKGNKTEQDNIYARALMLAESGVTNLFYIIPMLGNATWTDSNHFSVTNQSQLISFTIERDEQDRIVQLTTLLEKPQVLYTNDEGGIVSQLGGLCKYIYEKNIGIPFFPNTIIQHNLRQVNKDGNISLNTNILTIRNIHYLNLNPSFNNKSFSFDQFDSNSLHQSRSFISGTNIFNINSSTKEVFRRPEIEEIKSADWLATISKKAKTNKYQGRYNFWLDLKNMMNQ
ncbi:MAG: hypothetical protein IKQ24_08585 [Verrucomicrobia bacterium]|nr:hypothetical protein [Verrucomicrobiota bacterium]